MTDKIVQLIPEYAGEEFRLSGDNVLEAAKGQDWHRMAVIGQTEDGEIRVTGTANAGEIMILLEQVKHFIVFGRDEVKQ